jgi:SAM-dependent methyltransferase
MVPSVVRNINRRVCGKDVDGPSQGLAEWLKASHNSLPLERGVSVACGTGQKEFNLIRQGLVRQMLLYEFSPIRIKQGKELAARLGILDRITFCDHDPLTTEADGSLDLVYWNNALHHMPDAEKSLAHSRRLLKKGGVLLLDDFVGPNRFQWSDRQLNLASWVRSLLSDAYLVNPNNPGESLFRTLQRPSVAGMIKADPSEAADSEAIIPALLRHFPTADIIHTGGVVYMLALNDILANMDEKRDASLLEALLDLDQVCTRLGDSLYATALAIV